MTNYALNASMGSVAPLVSRDKGSFGNRIDCAGKQFANNVSNAAESAAVLAGSAVGYHMLNKATKGKTYKWNTKFNKELNGIIKEARKIIQHTNNEIANPKTAAKIKSLKFGKLRYNLLKGLIKVSEFNQKAFEKLAKTSGRQKLLGALVLGSLGLLMHVGQKHAYKAGQIDQKYTAQAQFQKTL